MKKKLAILILLGLLAGRAIAEEATVVPIVETEEQEQEQEQENEINSILIQNRSVYVDATVNGYDVTLKAHLQNYENVEYDLQWQVSKDNSNWQDISGANGMTYSLTVNEENYNNYYRVVVTITGVEVAD